MDQTNLDIYQGDDFPAEVEVLNEDDSPADLTGYIAQSHIRLSLTDANAVPLAQFTAAISGNIITLLLPHTESKKLTKTPCMWDLQVINGSGLITTLLAGQVNVTPEVTRVVS